MSRSTDAANDHGFPAGDFMIVSAGCWRVFDVKKCSTSDGSEIILFPSKERSLDQQSRDPWNNNQVFSIDEHGLLVSKASGYPIDIQDAGLVLRHPRSGISLPTASYLPETQEIRIHTSVGQGHTYILTYTPKRNPRLFFENGISALLPLNDPFAASGAWDGSSTTSTLATDGADLDDSDDSLDWNRTPKLVEISHQRERDAGVSEKERLRRTWFIVPIQSA
ncbi:hypothetical protein FA15DRAFT_664530 [Coprinopsis marcescibilis]|uniref:Uncharacterized protein n=1 Tax=Coprinopsis marcescibilis TaxID=230819 RepID=A0A5C3L975_COPMA|nr:hypothetical protein FA15DRAFT_664530 [Coprinopsis marcescibilis]